MSPELSPHHTEHRVRQEHEFPKEPEKRLEAILSSFNASPKAVTLLLLSESVTDLESLSNSFGQMLVGSQMAGTHQNTSPSYCHNTLCPIGLVAKKATIDYYGAEKLAGFALSEAGKRYGQPLAAFFLDFESRYNLSLFPIFGKTNTPIGRHRAPYHRAAILKSLRTGQQRAHDISQETGLSESMVGRHLRALKQSRIIEYNAVNLRTGQVQVEYFLVKQAQLSGIQAVRKDIILTPEIAKICQKLEKTKKPITCDNVYDSLPQGIQQRIKRGKLKETSLKPRIRVILSGLAKQGFLRRGQFKGGEVLSLARLTRKGQLVVNRLLLPLEDALADGPTLAKLQNEVLPKVLANLANIASQTAELYYPYSVGFRMRESATNKIKLLKFLTSGQGSTRSELAKWLGVNETTVGNYLKSMLAHKRVRRENVKGIYYYFLTAPKY